MGHEKTLTGLIPALAGANMIYGSGMLESGITFDYGQLVLDCEFARMIKHTIQGIPVNDENMRISGSLIHPDRRLSDLAINPGSFAPSLRRPFAQSYYLIRTPTPTSLSKVTRARPLSSWAANSIPLDSTPMSLAGARFLTTAIVLPTRSSGS